MRMALSLGPMIKERKKNTDKDINYFNLKLLSYLNNQNNNKKKQYKKTSKPYKLKLKNCRDAFTRKEERHI